MGMQPAPPDTQAYWPAGRREGQVFVVIGNETADRLVPLLAEEADNLAVPVAIPDTVTFSPDALSRDLLTMESPDVWMLLPDTPSSLVFAGQVSAPLIEAGLPPAAAAFLPDGLQLDDLLDRLPPSANEAATSPLDLMSVRRQGRSRREAFSQVVHALWLASGPPDEWLVPYIEALAGGGE